MKGLLIFITTFIAASAWAQPYNGPEKPAPITPITKAANCKPPSTTSFMELNNVRAMIHTAGNLWQVPGQNLALYEVPKNSGVMALFTSALWLGGTDVNGQLKLAALRYRQGADYWTGPLTQGSAETNNDNCLAYDRHFITVQDEIREFDAWFTAGEQDAINGTNTQQQLFPNYEVPLIIREWPAHGDITQGQGYYLAPFYDRNDDGQYRWEDGDYPWHDINKTKECSVDRSVSLYGDLNFWWVMNDKGNIHTETGAEPIGMEIRAQAFAFASNDEVNNMTFYNYELINRSTQTLQDTYFGCFTDGALGDPQDDYVGCDVNRGLAYYYNGDNFDGDNAGWLGYGDNPPAVGVDFFEGPYQDDDGVDNAYGIGPGEALNGIGFGDGIIDNERFGMRRFLYYSNSGQGADPSQTDPIIAIDYYNYLKGFWKDGTPFYYGGSGHISDAQADPSVIADFMFPGDTDPLGWGTDGVPQAPWTEQSANNPPDDRRFVQSAGPFVLKPGAVNNITVGVVWARANSGGPFASVEAVRRADDKAQALFENCFKVLDGPHSPDMDVQELENELILTLSNPTNSNNYNEEYIEFDPFISTADSTADRFYRFQGYQIYQLKSDEVSPSDVEDPNLARLVAQCDIEDGVSRLINFEFDGDLLQSIPKEMVDGADEGIQHSFRVTEDLFAQGDRRLVNFKTYYYVAVAYAYNNYKTYDPNDPNGLDGQQTPYIRSRKAAFGEVKVISAIPHNPMPESDGTGQLIEYGDGPRITRIDGHGNGNRALELTAASTEYILNNGFMAEPEYEYGSGPIDVKVIDPLNVVNGYFECEFVNYATSNWNGADTASWVINRYDYEGGNLMESIPSEKTIAWNNEQLIPQWGISVQIQQEKYFQYDGVSGGVESNATQLISADMTFADSSLIWISAVSDNDAFFPTNWIRSGTFYVDLLTPGAGECLDNTLPTYRDYIDPCNYFDWQAPNNWADADKQWARILDGGVAPHKLVGFESSYMPMAYYNYASPTSAKNGASISFLPSVDIVLTSDPTKWTRCPVIELGREPSLNVGGAEPGALRASASVDKEGKPESSSTGMGWFPGYAIDLETGARLYMAFGENSFLASENGADMLWNPTDNLIDNGGNPLMGGMHPVYIFSKDNGSVNNYLLGYDFPEYNPNTAIDDAQNHARLMMLDVMANNTTAKRDFYSSISWIAYPMASPNYEIDPLRLPTDVTIKLRVSKEYKNYVATGENGGNPKYSWNMETVATELGSQDRLADALKLINIVPNPYLAYSEYERNRLDTRVKITNLPERCTVKIYTVNGKLVRTILKDNPLTFADWNLTNEANVFVASGIYLIHVDVPGVGERVLKAFIGMRQVDLQGT